MTAQEIRQTYLNFAKNHGHVIIPRANLVPENDPTTLFTGSGMQQLVPYLLGQDHPLGTRVANSQTCFRAEDVEEVGDNRHTTFFEMLGNWSLGDYFKKEQLSWFFEFLTNELKLDPNKLFVTCFAGEKEVNISKDEESAKIWQDLFASKGIDANIVEIGTEKNGSNLGLQGGRIFYYDSSKNWWSRSGKPSEMPAGEPGGPDSEVFYEFTNVEHDPKFGKYCHPNCDCGRFMEIGNSVFMEFIKQSDGNFGELPKKNVDFGGGLERMAAAVLDNPDVFKISLIWPIIERLQEISGKKYEEHTHAMRVIADHLRAGVFLATDGVVPSNKTQGYVMRRLLRRAIRYAFDLGIEKDLFEKIIPTIIKMYENDYPEVAEHSESTVGAITKEEVLFRKTLRGGLSSFAKMANNKKQLSGADIFILYDTYGFPAELAVEECKKLGIDLAQDWRVEFEKKMEEQRQRSRTTAQGEFKGGLADASEMTTKLHTAAHLLNAALIKTLGSHVQQKGANITAERLRFDFTNPEKVNQDQITEIERIVNEVIKKDMPVTWKEEDAKEALASGAIGAFGHKYPDRVKVYSVGAAGDMFSREICGGPHVEHTGQLAEGEKKFKIIKEEASSAGVRRIKAVLIK